MKIRSMTLDDIPAVTTLGNQSIELAVSDQSHFWNRERLTSWIEADQDINLVVEQDGDVIAFQLTQLHYPSKVGYLSDMVVSPQFRQQGIGTLLAEATIKAMAGKGMTYVYALSQNDNVPIEKLLIKLGFVKGELMTWFEKRID